MDRSYEILASGSNVFRPFEDDFSALEGLRIQVDVDGVIQTIDVLVPGGPYPFAEEFGEALFEAFEALPSLTDAPDLAVTAIEGVPVSVGDVIPLVDGGVLEVGTDGVVFDPGDAYDDLVTGDVIGFGLDFSVRDESGDIDVLGLGVEVVGDDVLPTDFNLTGDALINTPEDLVVNVRGSDGDVTTGGQAGDSLIIDFLTFDVVSVEPIVAEGSTDTFRVVEVAPPPPPPQPEKFAVLAYGGGGRDATEDQLGYVTAGRDLEEGFSRRPTEGPDKLKGTGGADEIDLLAGDDTVFGEGGNDLLLGRAGADEIDGGAGNDRIDGGAGDDVLIGETGDDIYTFVGTFGTDTVRDQGRSELNFDANAVRSFFREIDDLRITAVGGAVVVEDYFRTDSSVTVFEGGVARAVNLSPSSVSVSDASVAEDAGVGAFVARVLVIDDDDSQHTITLGGNGAADFAVDGNDIVTARALDFETVAEYSLTVTATDPAGNSLSEALTVTVEDVDEGGNGNGNGNGNGTGQGLTVEEARDVALLYEAGLDRDGNIDLPGLNFWIDAREGGFTQRQVADAFLLSNEFNESFGEPFDTTDPRYLEDKPFVQALYENVLDRDADQPGLDFWCSVLAQPAFDRTDLLLAFSDSAENIAGSPQIQTLEEVSAGEWAFVG
ncbi:MAG: DUF4214 domain-containing protein [Pseudomonadota bacterium]